MNESETTNNLLEQMFIDAPDSDLPQIIATNADNTKTFAERYDLLKTHLGSIHDKVGIGALLASAKEDVPYNALIHLNQHGKGHVEVVMSRAAELVGEICETQRLSAFELFILLCAIQIHDIGNISGRKDHTTSFQNDFYELAPACFITDTGLKEMIFQIACVHGGSINDDRDTIRHLYDKTKLLNRYVRPQLLAAILRFADELADNYTRALELDDMPEISKIFHAYSETLHTVDIIKNEQEAAHHILLRYYMTQEKAARIYNREGVDIPLIEEILNRAEKMEQERRYCTRYLIPYIVIKEIKVEIDVQFPKEISVRNRNFTLRESGYPDSKVTIEKRDDIINEMTSKGNC